MSFMQPDIQHGLWFEVDGPAGTECIPHDLVGDFWPFPHVREFEPGGNIPVPDELSDYCQNRTCHHIRLREGWGCRLSAPGYLDCTEWTVFDTEEEAQAHLGETMGDDEPEPEEGDLTTTDHLRWYQYGRLVLKLNENDDHEEKLKEFMEAERFWPNVWFISDHGNAHLITLS